jgi:WD40 repeat protein/tRNA A-37 threonylcarbamoyl transferase component Bud32
MPENTNRSTVPDERFEKVLAEVLLAEEAGKPLDLSRLVRGHPELETQLREYFRNRDGFDRLAPHLAPVPPRPGASAAPPHLSAGSRFGDYEVLGELGRGGMGVVYKARQRSLPRLVAIKMILAGHLASPEQVERFQREARLVAQLDHPHIVPIYEVGQQGGQHYFSMKLIEGRSLSHDLAHYHRHHKAAAFLVARVARAVHFAHERGILHRDLKPGNILLDARKQPHVTDFGLAKRLDVSDSLSPEGAVIGTAGYMAPEQAAARDRRLTPAADVYSLGAILYKLLTGRPPFQAATVVETLWQVLEREPPPPRQLNPAVPRDLETICLRCLDKRPAHRYPSAAALAEDLERWVEGKPILARRVGWPERAWLWCRRKPAFAALCAAAVVLITLAGTLFWAYSLASRKADDAGQEANKAGHDRDEAVERTRADAYLANMRRAQKHVNGGELTKARALLAKWEPKKGAIDYRAWEWYFLDAQCRETSFSVRGHLCAVQAVAWGPDDELLASADRLGNVRVWRPAESKTRPLFEMQANTGGGVAGLAWSPDGKHLAAVCRGVVKLWDARSGKEERSLNTDGNSLAVTVPYGPAGIVGFTGVLTDTGIASLMWGPNSDKLALVDANGRVQVWDLTARKDRRDLGTHECGVHSAAWSPDGKWLASVGGDGLVTIWDPANGKLRDLKSTVPDARSFTGVDKSYALTWSSDGKRLKLVCNDASIRTLDASSGEPVSASQLLVYRDNLFWAGLPSPPGTGPGGRYLYGPGGKLLASIQPRSGDVTIWDAATGQEMVSLRSAGSARPAIPGNLDGPEYRTGCLPAWDRRGQRLALGDADGFVKTWYIGRGHRSVRNPVVNPYSGSYTWSADSRHMFCTTFITLDDLLVAHKKRREWDAARKRAPGPGMRPPRPFSPFPVPQGQPAVAGLVVNPRQRIQCLDVSTGAVVRTWDTGIKPDILAASPDGKWLASVSNKGLLQLCLADGGGPAVTLDELSEHAAPAGGRPLLSWNADGKRLAFSTTQHATIHLWDPNTRKPVRNLAYGKPLRSLAWSPDGKRLAAAAEDGTVKVWDVRSGKPTATFPYFVKQERPPPNLMGGNTFASSVLSWGPDSKRLAVYGEDEVITVWDVDAEKELVALRHPSTEPRDTHNVVCTVAWSPRGKRLAAASPDGTFVLWDTATWQEVLALRPPAVQSIAPRAVASHAGELVWSPDGWQLAFYSSGGGVTIWDATPEEEEPRRQKAAPAK